MILHTRIHTLAHRTATAFCSHLTVLHTFHALPAWFTACLPFYTGSLHGPHFLLTLLPGLGWFWFVPAHTHVLFWFSFGSHRFTAHLFTFRLVHTYRTMVYVPGYLHTTAPANIGFLGLVFFSFYCHGFWILHTGLCTPFYIHLRSTFTLHLPFRFTTPRSSPHTAHRSTTLPIHTTQFSHTTRFSSYTVTFSWLVHVYFGWFTRSHDLYTYMGCYVRDRSVTVHTPALRYSGFGLQLHTLPTVLHHTLVGLRFHTFTVSSRTPGYLVLVPLHTPGSTRSACGFTLPDTDTHALFTRSVPRSRSRFTFTHTYFHGSHLHWVHTYHTSPTLHTPSPLHTHTFSFSLHHTLHTFHTHLTHHTFGILHSQGPYTHTHFTYVRWILRLFSGPVLVLHYTRSFTRSFTVHGFTVHTPTTGSFWVHTAHHLVHGSQLPRFYVPRNHTTPAVHTRYSHTFSYTHTFTLHFARFLDLPLGYTLPGFSPSRYGSGFTTGSPPHWTTAFGPHTPRLPTRFTFPTCHLYTTFGPLHTGFSLRFHHTLSHLLRSVAHTG